MNRTFYLIFTITLVTGMVLAASMAYAFIGPSAGQTPGTGGGLFIVDPNLNIGFGTSSSTPVSTFDATSTETGPSSFGYVFTVASTSNPGIAVKKTSATGFGYVQYVWSVRDFGNLQLYRESANLPGFVIFDINPYGDVGIGAHPTSTGSGVPARLTIGGNVLATGSLTGSNYAGQVPAGNVTSGIFGSLQGNGNFAFPASLAVGTTTTTGLPSNGLYVTGNTTIAGALNFAGAAGFSALNLNNENVIGVNSIAINDTGVGEGITWGSENIAVYETAQGGYQGFVFNTASGYPFIFNGGNIGVGTSTPATTLHIVSDTGLKLSSTSGGYNFYLIPAAPGLLYKKGDGTNVLSIDNSNNGVAIGSYAGSSSPSNGLIVSGSVGVGTSTPAYVLSVNGEASFNNNVVHGVATPSATTDAANKSYVDSVVGGGSGSGSFTTLTVSATTTLSALTPSRLVVTDASSNLVAGTNVITAANVLTSVANTTGSAGNLVFSSSPTLSTPVIANIRGGTAAGSTLTLKSTSGVGTTDAVIFQVGNNGATEAGRFIHSGYLGLGTTTPSYQLDVVGGAQFSQPVIVGTPTQTNHAATKSYVDSIVGGGSGTGDFATLNVSGTSTLATNANDRVGIGTASPTQKLDVVGVGKFSGNIESQAAIKAKQYFLLDYDGDFTGANYWSLSQASAGSAAYLSYGGIGSGAAKVTFLTSGDVGVGTTAPASKLDVQSSGSASDVLRTLASSGSSTVVVREDASTDLRLRLVDAGGTERLTLDTRNSGRIGINDISPSYALDVTGTGQFTSTVIVGTPTAANHAATKDYVDSVISGSSQYWALSGSNLYASSTSYNVGIGTASPASGYKLDVNGFGKFASGVRVGSQAGVWQYYPNVVSYTADATYAGAVVIHTNISRGANEMFKLRVIGYGYGNSSNIDFTVVGYGYSGQNGSVDGLPGAITNYAIVDNGNDGLTKRIGVDANGKVAVAVGDDTSSFYYYRIAADYWSTRNQVDASSGWSVDRSTVSGFGWLDIKTLSSTITETSTAVGVKDTTPSYTLDVTGTGQFTSTVIVGTPTAASHAATKGYVDSVISGSSQFWALSGSNLYASSTSWNVGIATTTPAHRLVVVGNIAALGGNVLFSDAASSNREYISSFDSGITGLNTRGVFGFFADDSLGASATSPTAGISAQGIYSSTVLGVASSSPGYALTVVGTGYFSQPVIVGTPTAANHAATKDYVDTAVAGGTGVAAACNGDATCEMNGANLNGGNITGVNKLTATVIDPVYAIGGTKYSTYVADTIGLKTEMYGKARLTSRGGKYSYVIDFNKVTTGSDLWLFWQTLDKANGMNGVTMTLSPEFDGRTWYELRTEKAQIVIHGDEAGTVSYHLVGPRHDAGIWGNLTKDQNETPSFILNAR